MNKELNRLATYADFPLSWGVLPSKLARFGFHVTGDGNTTVCFECGISVEQWQFGDDPKQKHRREAPNCSMVSGQNSTNAPLVPLSDDFDRNVMFNSINTGLRRSGGDVRDSSISTQSSTSEVPEFYKVCRSALDRAKRRGVLDADQQVPVRTFDPENPNFQLRYEAERRATFTNFPTSCPVTPAALARAGFFYKGPADRVQCAFCQVLLRNWVPGDDPMTEHRRHMPQCPLLNSSGEHENVRIEGDVTDAYTGTAEGTHATDSPSTAHGSQGMSEVDSRSVQNQLTFSSLSFEYKHPQYASADARRQTFLVDGVLIPRGQNIEVLVDAGFFHVGPDDNVKCFCCDVGLKNWQPDDSPWVQHAHWRPRCDYLRQNRDTAFIADAQRGRSASTDVSRSARVSRPASATQLHDVTSSGRRNKKRTTAAAMTDVNGDEQEDQEDSEPADTVATDNNVDDYDAETVMLLEENRQLRDARTCRVCMDLEVNVVFLPCGHLVSCDSCAPALRNCAVCRSLIRGTVKVFLT